MSTNKTSSKKARSKTGETRHAFQAETRQVLRLMVNSLYSNKEIFLRELISNASDALDKLRFLSLQDPGLVAGGTELHIEIETDPEAGTLTVRDNGIGMNHTDVMDNIGTIAKSGTRQFLEQLGETDRANANLIGQFGVGFYSAFIVADEVIVLTRKAGEDPDQGVRWVSDGGGEFTIQQTSVGAQGTEVILRLKPEEHEFLESWTLRSLVQRYSDHIGFAIRVRGHSSDEPDGEKSQWEQVNKATALWTLPKSALTDEEYQGFYKTLTHDLDNPLCWAHNKVEGAQSYTTLLFIPSKAPIDLMLQRDERQGMRLYVNRVFIMDAAQALLPHYLRFIRGVVDSQDLPLNVSRELLQENELVGKIRAGLVRRSLDIIERLGREEPEKFRTFWQQFGAVLKEGVVEDFGNRERILKLLRFASTQVEARGEVTDLDAYIARMKTGQEAIYYITAEHHTAASHSPHLEMFRKSGIEVLLMSDRVDEWMMSYLHEYEKKPFKSVAKGDIDLTGIVSESSPEGEGYKQTGDDESLDAQLIQRITEQLAERVSAVRASRRLTESASCLVLNDHEMALHLQRMLKQAGQEIPASKPILELNPAHPLVERLATEQRQETFSMLALLLYEQAVLSEGGVLPDPAGFVHRINKLMTASRGGDQE